MSRSLQFIVAISIGLFVLTSKNPDASGVQQDSSADQQPAVLVVRLPANAVLEVEGREWRSTNQTGPTRLFVTPPLEVGKRYSYTLKVVADDVGGTISYEKVVQVQAGATIEVDLSSPPSDADGIEDSANDAESANAGGLKKRVKKPDVVYIATPQEVVEKMLELANVHSGDLVYDLGCGDGRIVVTAAKKYGVKAFGFDIDPERVAESIKNVKENRVEKLATIKKQDIFTLDFSNATVVALYLLPRLNAQLLPQLQKLKPGSRIVSHDFDIAGVVPDKVVDLTVSGDEHRIYLWTTPLKFAK